MQFSIFLLTILCFATPQVMSRICVNDIEHLLIKERRVTVADIMWEAKTADAVECAQTCIRLKSCTAFGFDSNTSLCQHTSGSGPPSKAGVHSVFSYIGGWPPQTDPNCYNSTCGKDEVCIPGDTGDGDTCSHSCFKMERSCPVIPGATPINHSRGVGSIYIHTCSHGYVANDSATCLPTGNWTKTLKLDEICTPLYEGTCDDDSPCLPFNGVCVEDRCTCAGGHVVAASISRCVQTLYEGTCNDYSHCSSINGVCVGKRCTCGGGLVFAASIYRCVKKCDQDWVQYDRYCYRFEETKLTFEKGFKFCAELNSSLLYVESDEENEFIKTDVFKGQDHGHVMIGLREADYNETWWTLNGNLTATYLDWWEWEQINPEEECTVYYRYEEGYHWADVKCSDAFKFICKKET